MPANNAVLHEEDWSMERGHAMPGFSRLIYSRLACHRQPVTWWLLLLMEALHAAMMPTKVVRLAASRPTLHLLFLLPAQVTVGEVAASLGSPSPLRFVYGA
jgi:hypothetical protein